MWDVAPLVEAMHRAGGLDRRLFLACSASLSATACLGARGSNRHPKFSADPFRLGVASGDPTSSGIVLWTRLAPRPLQPGGGMPPEDCDVGWEIAHDQSFRRIVQRGRGVARAQMGHSVHVEVDGLDPDRWYWYRFRAGDAESPIGRTRTLPPRDAQPDELLLAVASCQHFEQGLYTAYEHMAREEPDLVIFLGDYIYEYAGNDQRVRTHVGREVATLDDYRIRHAQYKSDKSLQAMHAQSPWVVTWDDHECDNNYANDIAEDGLARADFLARRANAYQAYYEHLPLRRTSLPRGPHMQIYRALSFGRLAELLVLDTRQYRTDQPNHDRAHDINDAARSAEATMLGSRQKDWFEKSLASSPAQWNVLAQQVMMGMVDVEPGESQKFSMDQWPGYVHERQQLVQFLQERQVANPVVLTGDYHANWVNNLRVDDRREEMPVVATEFVGTSISSGGNGEARPPQLESTLAENPCVAYHNRQRGYVRCRITPAAWQSEFRTLDYVTRPGSPIRTHKTFVIESGRPGAEPA